jgi:hypothetical protein
MAIEHDNSMGIAMRVRLEELHSAYVGLQVLSGIADVDSHHVAAVMCIVNQSFADCLEACGPSSSPGGSGLRLVGK